MRMMIATLALMTLAAPVAAQHESHGAAASFPPGWQGRLDRDTLKLSDVMFMPMGGGYHVKTGPHVILWQPERTAEGVFTASATFTQSKAPARLEGYGLLVGGQNLSAPNQDYLYFLVRHDGSFMVRHRAGTEVHTLMNWTKHAAIAQATAESSGRNTLAIESRDADVRFLVNGQVVHSMNRAPMLNTNGIVGLRVGHHVDVMVSDFLVARSTTPSK